MKQEELGERSQFFQRVLKMGNFGQNAKGGIRILCKILEIGHFLAELCEARKWIIEPEFQAMCACARKIPRQQYLWMWCQSVVPNDFPRDFGSWVAFVS